MFGEIISFKLMIQRMLQENDALPRASDPAMSALHAKSDTRNLFHQIDKLTKNNRALLFFSVKETIQTFNGSI